MANELDMSFTIVYDNNLGTEFPIALANILRSQATKKFIRHYQSIGITEEALDLGELAAPFGLFVGINWDETNYLEVRSATGAGNDIVKVPPLCFCVFFWGSDVTAPFAIANTAACNFEYWTFAP